jgi:hypothetical protein
VTATQRTKAHDGEDCEYCGYPFDAGDSVIALNDDCVYCSRHCLLKHEGLNEEAERELAGKAVA